MRGGGGFLGRGDEPAVGLERFERALAGLSTLAKRFGGDGIEPPARARAEGRSALP